MSRHTPTHYAQRHSHSHSHPHPSTSTPLGSGRASGSPVNSMMRGDGTDSPPPRPTPSSRMALSALVNSPPHSPPPRDPSLSHSHSSSTHSASMPKAYTHPHAPSSVYDPHQARYVSPIQDRFSTRAGSSGHPNHQHQHQHQPQPQPQPPSWPQTNQSQIQTPGSRMSRDYSHDSFGEYDRRSPTKSYPHPSTPIVPITQGVVASPSVPGVAGAAVIPTSELGYAYPLNGDTRGEGSRRPMVPGPGLIGGEDVWEEALRSYQAQREKEASEIASLAGAFEPSPRKRRVDARDVGPHDPNVNGGEPGDIKPNTKSKGSSSDHARRVAQREARDAAIAAGDPPPKRKYNRKPRKGKDKPIGAALDDELLGLAEGEDASQSIAPRSSMSPGLYGDSELGDTNQPDLPDEPIDLSPDAIMPCGLTRAEVISKVAANDISGLSEVDVKMVQDEIWARKKDLAGVGAPTRKDGSMRKKPGPAKGWKKLRGDPTGRAGSARGDNDSDAGDTSIAGDAVNGEAEVEIAALLPEDSTIRKGKGGGKRRKMDIADDEMSRLGEDSDEEKPHLTADDLASSLIDEPDSTRKGKSKSKLVPGGGGKARNARPTRESKEMLKKAEVVAANLLQQHQQQQQYDEYELGYPKPNTPALDPTAMNPDVLAAMAQSNLEDMRGVSEMEAKVRAGLVDELQKQAWASIVRDIPRMYRVYQAYDSVVKQDCSRKAQAAHRNAFAQRNLKPTFRSVARINKDATNKAKRVIKEMLLYWRKNEKDELAARKKAEKEALDRAKAEEEAREAKRQARKLNFLLTQTELYSHFIGKKIKTKEAEAGEGENVAMVHESDAKKVMEGANEDLGLDANGEPLPDIDYDDDDEENLRRHAARGAQAAVQAAKDKAKAFDDARNTAAQTLDLDGDELNFQNPTLAEDSVTITQPKMLMAQLKEYQLKGLTWLGNLYEQGINGILADEMGLGKTIQSISLLAYLAEHHNLWGPFLVIAPSSTLHNWQQELARFVPRIKALPYWGSPKDRETLRKIWSRKNQTFTEDSPFHVLVTSYQLAVQDEKYFQGMRWQYMILDEAQAIKSSSSARWKSLLSLHCRNRLLLTGTPIQNSMHELWALLHFIMPSLFDSHEEFSEWFSKDIENAAGGGSGTLKPEQLRRLHMILKPFMLRRVKKHVQKELGDKIEIDLLVDLSQRQLNIYKALRQRVSISDLIAQANNLTDSAGAKNLMNLVMQFRKVCNHPDLFERADVVSPFVFGTFPQSGNLARQGDLLYCPDAAKNAIEVRLPRIIWTDGGKLDVPGEQSLAGSDTRILGSLMNIWNAAWINDSLKKDHEGEFGFLTLLDISPGQAAARAKSHPLVSLLRDAQGVYKLAEDGPYEEDGVFAVGQSKKFASGAPLVPDYRPSLDATPLRDITSRAWNQSFLSRGDARFAVESAVAPFIEPVISTRAYYNTESRVIHDPLVQQAVYGVTPSERNDPTACQRLANLAPGVGPLGILGVSPPAQTPLSSMRVPPTKRLIVDSAKLARLDELLRKLKDGGHRVLLYFQMTKMMDLVEEYLIYRQYKYLRLDGSSPIGERRDMVTSWQTNSDIFVFCLSTRAGGLGINLTAADTVIFYDHDWNPSNDAQAMDRAHRVGQTKQVTVYRLIARGTIEERIVKLARAKKDVQDIVVGTKSLTDVAKPSEIVSLFMDDEELADSVAKRKQAEAHGYIVPTSIPARPKSAFGDGLGINDDDEDDFFSLTKKPANGEDEDFGDEAGSGARTPKDAKKKSTKRKAEGDEAKKPQKKKVKIALGPDGLPI